jgi:signal transduction histidine kinase
LAAGIAHEINTPTQYVADNIRFFRDSFREMQGMITAYESLLAAARAAYPQEAAQVDAASRSADWAYLSKEIPSAIEQSLEGVGRVAKIVRAMKEFSHPGKAEKAPYDINHAIEVTTTVARNEWKYVADLKLELDPSLGEVPCHAGEFNQVILNMVVNAAHAIADVTDNGSKNKGVITITTRKDGDWAEVRIQDTGSGIPEAIRQKIFEPFFTTKPQGKGTGQGLAIARSVVVEKHGGTLGLESEVGKGTTFIIRLPSPPPSAA